MPVFENLESFESKTPKKGETRFHPIAPHSLRAEDYSPPKTARENYRRPSRNRVRQVEVEPVDVRQMEKAFKKASRKDNPLGLKLIGSWFKKLKKLLTPKPGKKRPAKKNHQKKPGNRPQKHSGKSSQNNSNQSPDNSGKNNRSSQRRRRPKNRKPGYDNRQNSNPAQQNSNSNSHANSNRNENKPEPGSGSSKNFSKPKNRRNRRRNGPNNSNSSQNNPSSNS